MIIQLGICHFNKIIQQEKVLLKVTEDQFVKTIMQKEGLAPKTQQGGHKEGHRESSMRRGRSIIHQVMGGLYFIFNEVL